MPVERLLVAKEKLEAKSATMIKEEDITEINNKRHVQDAINWIDECVKGNMNSINYDKFDKFNKILDEKRNEKFDGLL